MSNKAKLATAGVSAVALRGSIAGRLPGPVRSSSFARRRGPWRRLLKWALLTVTILSATYLVVANVLLRTRLLRNALSGPSAKFALTEESAALLVDYESAYSILPGRVHVEGLSIRGRERTEEWRLTLDRADVALSLRALLHRRFHVTRVRSSGFTIRARLRLERAEATSDVIAALPPIPGFADPPLLDDTPKPPPLTDATYNLWTLDLEDVEVEHVREVWIHGIRAQGDTRVRGRWLFRPMRWLDVGPATVEVNGVDISYGSYPLAIGVRGSFGATVHAFDLRQVDGLATFDHVSYDGELRGRAIVSSALRLLAPRDGVTITQWEGPFAGRVVLDHGALADGTRLWTEALDSRVEADGVNLAAGTRGEVRVGSDALATLDTRVSDLRVSRLGVEQARVASIAAAVTSRHRRIPNLLDDARFTLDVTGAQTNDVGAWRRFLPKAVVVRSGLATAEGHADGSIAERRGRADLKLSVRRLSVERGSDRFTAEVTSDAELREVSLATGSAIGSATISAVDVDGRLGPAFLAGKLKARVNLPRGAWANQTFDLSGTDVVLGDVSIRSAPRGAAIVFVPSLEVVAARFALAPSRADGHVSIEMRRADLADLRGLQDLLPFPAGLAIEGGRGRAKLHAEIDLGSGAVRGDANVFARGLRARAGSTALVGDLDGVVKARHVEGATDLSGSTLAITHARAGKAAADGDGWWGTLALREGTLRTSGPARFTAKAHLTAKDASPGTKLVSQNTVVPAWAADIFTMPGLEADADLRADASSLEVRSLVARGGGNSVRAEYARRNGREDGAVLLDLGWIALGYDLADGATGLVLFGPEAWYRRKTSTMRDDSLAARRDLDAAEQFARYGAMTPALRRTEAQRLAAECANDMHACDGASVENLVRAADAYERDALRGTAYAPVVAAAAKRGRDGATLDPLVVGSVAEALRMGGASTLDGIAHIAAMSDSGTSRGKVIAVIGRASPIRREGPYSVGTLTTGAEPVYFVTPFATPAVPDTVVRFRGVFVQRYASTNQAQGEPASLVLVGAFGP